MTKDPPFRLEHIPEPTLTFGHAQRFTDPRDGLTLYGPFTSEQLSGPVTIGIVGPSESRDRLRHYLSNLHKPVFGETVDIARPVFPGLNAAFGVAISEARIVESDVPRTEIDKFLKYSDGYQRVHNLCSLFTERLIDYQKREEVPVHVWFVAIPDAIYTYGRPNSRIPASSDNISLGLPKQDWNGNQTFLFDEMEGLKDAYAYEINFHNQLKAKLLGDRIVTQIIRDATIGYAGLWNNESRVKAERKFDSAKAWNISNTLYYKLGGLPWKLGDVRPSVCYLGLVYKKLHQAASDQQACCAAQMFLDSGDGVVFRGNMGPWYNPRTKEYHLHESDAAELLANSLEAFQERSDNRGYPEEVFIHAKTPFNDEEWRGFSSAAEGKTNLVGVWIRPDSGCKIYRDDTYSVPRGSVLLAGDGVAFLWTKGFIPRLQTQLGLETPNPLKVNVCRGEADIMVVCRDLLALTKLNYNSCIFADGLPVTLRFADRIGEVLTAGRDVECGVLTFKHYI